jgi:subtilase family serine protease
MASAICPSCNILLVEADSNYFTDLGAAVNQAVAMGANEISNSYGTSQETSNETSYDTSYYKHSGVVVTVSSGDNGYNKFGYPSASQWVTAVGGTSLTRDSSTRGWSESAWNGAGSGCSRYESKPPWQKDNGCSKRTVADVAAVADPNTGVAVYDSTGSSGGANWYVFGGTSVSSPIIAAVYALKGNASTANYGQYPYANGSYASNLYDVVSGSNGGCRTKYMCTAGPGYDGPTGLGTPRGVDAF